MDTVVWLLDFPVSHGYAMVFIAGFSLMGLLMHAFRPIGTGGSALERIREREGLAEARTAPTPGRMFAIVRRMLMRVLALVMAAGLVLGILSLIGVPLTRAYIHANGVTAAAERDGDWVTFTAEDGETYTLPNDFFTPSEHPDAGGYIPSGEPIVVRYLPGHPQAYVIDRTPPQ